MSNGHQSDNDDDAKTPLKIRNIHRYKRQIKGESPSSSDAEDVEDDRRRNYNSRVESVDNNNQLLTSIATNSRHPSERHRHPQPTVQTQTKLTAFFTPRSKTKPKPVSPNTALRNTEFQGINVAIKNEFDDLSEAEIKDKLWNFQQLLSNDEIVSQLPDHGKKLKGQIAKLDEALLRVKARTIIRTKNKPQAHYSRLGNATKLSFDSNMPRSSEASFPSWNNHSFKSNGLAKNLDETGLKNLVDSIHSMSLQSANEGTSENTYEPCKELQATLFPHQKEAVSWMINRETHDVENQPYGGLVCDSMGLGKTVQMIALLLHDHAIPMSNSVTPNLQQSECTLIVCPVSVMDHWECEIKRWTTKGRVVVYKYYGNNRMKDVKRLSSNYHVILTTYGCVQSEWSDWSKVEAKRLSDVKEIKKEVSILQHHQQRYVDDTTIFDQLKSKKTKLMALVNQKHAKPALHRILFRRVICDEAHLIKNHKAKTHKAIVDLYGSAQWFMTATPIQNSLDDLFAALRFIRYPHYMDYKSFKQNILNHSRGVTRLKTILTGVMLRRLKTDYVEEEKQEQAQENSDNQNTQKKKKLIQLPEKHFLTHEVEFSTYERFIYDQLSKFMNKIFGKYHAQNAIGKNFSQCLKMLLRLRQSCNSLSLIANSVQQIHSLLNTNGDKNRQQTDMNLSGLLSNENGQLPFDCNDAYLDEVRSALQHGDEECTICLDAMDQVSITSCGHRFCTECLNHIIDETETIVQKKYKALYDAEKHLLIECPICRKQLRPTQVTRVVDTSEQQNQQEQKPKQEKEDVDASSKLKKLMELLHELHTQSDPDAKCIIFSQWTSMLDIIESEIEREEYGYCRLDGSMTASKRSQSIRRLNEDRNVWVMLISLKAGGVGLNLVAANHVFMMDIWWNPAVEDQACDRVHRIGQTKQVYIHRVIVKNSVEQKVLQLQEKKRKIADDALNLKHSRNRPSANLSAKDLIELFYDYK